MKSEILEVCKTNKLSKEKTTEIVSMMATLVEKSSEWESKSKVNVTDEEDVDNMTLARTNRLTIKKERGEAEKYIKSKRTEVQAKMAEYTAEDKALLKISQLVEAKAKSIEADLEQKEKFAEIKKAERLKRLVEERRERLLEVVEDPDIYPLDTMSDIAFETTLESLIAFKEKKEKEEKELEEQRIAAEAAAKEAEEKRTNLLKERYDKLLLYEGYGPSIRISDIADLEENVFEGLLQKKKDAKKSWEEDQKNKEQERLAQARALAEIKEKAIKAQKELDEKNKKEAIEKAEKEKAESAAKAEAERLEKAPDKEKLILFVDSFTSTPQILNSTEANRVYNDILVKFSGFTKWAKTEIDKL